MTVLYKTVCVEFRLIVAFDKAPKPVNGSTAKEEEEVWKQKVNTKEKKFTSHEDKS